MLIGRISCVAKISTIVIRLNFISSPILDGKDKISVTKLFRSNYIDARDTTVLF